MYYDSKETQQTNHSKDTIETDSNVSNADGSIDKLPNETLLKIFRNLNSNLATLWNVGVVCQNWYRLVMYIRREIALGLKTEGNRFFYRRNFTEAIERYSKCIKMDPYNSVYYSNRSAAYLFRKRIVADLSKSLEDAKKAIELHPDWERGYMRLGTTYFRLNKWLEAYITFTKGLEIDPFNEYFKEMAQDSRKREIKRSWANGFFLSKSLMNVSRSGNIPRLQAYLAHTNELDSKDIKGKTALHHAAANGAILSVEELLCNGAKSLVDCKGRTPVQLALKKDLNPNDIERMVAYWKYGMIVRLLLQHTGLIPNSLAGLKSKIKDPIIEEISD